jgi:hypothetical protein
VVAVRAEELQFKEQISRMVVVVVVVHVLQI